MPVRSTVVTVTTAATLLSAGGNDTHDLAVVIVRNDSGVSLFLGGADVTVANGLSVPTATNISVDLSVGDALYGVVAAATQPIQVLRTRT